MDKLSFLGLIATYIVVAIFYLSEPKRFALAFERSYFPQKQYLIFKVIAWILLLIVCAFWVGEPYGWEVGIARWLTALTLMGFVVIFLVPKKPQIFKLSLLISILMGGITIVF